ncbi:Hypothetical predicted protein, partial [Paramuricea clavata]
NELLKLKLRECTAEGGGERKVSKFSAFDVRIASVPVLTTVQNYIQRLGGQWFATWYHCAKDRFCTRSRSSDKRGSGLSVEEIARGLTWASTGFASCICTFRELRIMTFYVQTQIDHNICWKDHLRKRLTRESGGRNEEMTACKRPGFVRSKFKNLKLQIKVQMENYNKFREKVHGAAALLNNLIT